jgi:hypothetical protein
LSGKGLKLDFGLFKIIPDKKKIKKGTDYTEEREN